jgi:hypothetical protein
MWIEITVYKTVTQQEASVVCCQCVYVCVCGGGVLLICKERGAVQRYGLLQRKVKFGKNNLLERRYNNNNNNNNSCCYYYLWLRCTDFSRVLFHFFDITSVFN